MISVNGGAKAQYRWRSRVIPPSPATCREIDLNMRFTSINGVSTAVWNFQGEDDNYRIIVLSHPSLVELIGSVSRLGIDATFKSAPNNFYQLLIVNGYVGSASSNPIWVPMFYILMPNKRRDTYRITFGGLDQVG